MLASTISTELNIVDRSVFNKIPSSSKDNNIYFVREGTNDTSSILSLYLGDKRQCDILDITDLVEVDFNDPQNNYNIPQEYQISNKMLMAVQTVTDQLGNDTVFYHVFCWNGEKFVDCFGTPNNVIVCTALPSHPTKNMIYIDLDTRSVYVFNGQSYINIISPDEYATVNYVQNIYTELLRYIASLKGAGTPAGRCATRIISGMCEISGNLVLLEE